MSRINTFDPYMEHLRIEHSHLNDTLRDTAQALAKWKQKPEAAQAITNHLEALRGELQHHFQEEEEGGARLGESR